jgi:hypothetical protein
MQDLNPTFLYLTGKEDPPLKESYDYFALGAAYAARTCARIISQRAEGDMDYALFLIKQEFGEEANVPMGRARLTEAAPDLLEALKDALAFLDRPDIATYEWYKLAPEHVGKFRRAIAKAEDCK